MKKDLEKEFHEGSPAPDAPPCGVVMPISPIDGCDERHWSDVKEILFSAIEDAGFTPSLVSDADDVGVIHKRIIQNLYSNPIVICDVSGKNPNVMFELGMRLAFDKPTIIVKDEKTGYIFDTGTIEHLEYPRDLRFGKIIDFKVSLSKKIRGTSDKAENDSSYSTFLKNFGEFTVAKIETKEVSKEDYIIDSLRDIRSSIRRLGHNLEAGEVVDAYHRDMGLIEIFLRNGYELWKENDNSKDFSPREYVKNYVMERSASRAIELRDYFPVFSDFKKYVNDKVTQLEQAESRK